MSDPDLGRVYHEAGHAVVAQSVERAFTRVSIVEGGDPGEACTFVRLGNDFAPDVDADGDTLDLIRRDVCTALAGYVAEQKIAGTYDEARTDQDITVGVNMAMQAVGSPEQLQIYMDRRLAQVARIVDEQWAAVQAVAAALLERGELAGDDVRAIMASLGPARPE